MKFLKFTLNHCNFINTMLELLRTTKIFYILLEAKMKKFKGLEIVISAVAVILVVIISAILGVLTNIGVLDFKVSTFTVILTSLCLGIGLYTTVFAIFRKGGYEFSVGSIILIIGICLLMHCLSVKAVINVIITVALFLIAFASLFILKASYLTFVPTDKEEGHVSYMDKLNAQKEEEKNSEEELPEIKSFKD